MKILKLVERWIKWIWWWEYDKLNEVDRRGISLQYVMDLDLFPSPFFFHSTSSPMVILPLVINSWTTHSVVVFSFTIGRSSLHTWISSSVGNTLSHFEVRYRWRILKRLFRNGFSVWRAGGMKFFSVVSSRIFRAWHVIGTRARALYGIGVEGSGGMDGILHE